MYIKQICINKKAPSLSRRFKVKDLKMVDSVISNNFYQEYNEKCDIMDNFSFLDDMYWITENNLNELSKGENIDEYREYNRRLLNYLNAVYVYVQFCYNFGRTNDKLRDLMNKFYNEENEYRFLLEYRNCVIHKGAIIKQKRNKWLIKLDELIKIEEENIAYKKKRGKKKNEELNAFIDILNALKEHAYEIEGDYYIDTNIIYNAHKHVNSLHKEAINLIYHEFIESLLVWLINQIYHYDEYWYTLIVDKDLEDVFEPNYYLELYIDRLMNIYGKESEVFKSCVELLQRRGYTYLFTYDLLLQDYVENISS